MRGGPRGESSALVVSALAYLTGAVWGTLDVAGLAGEEPGLILARYAISALVLGGFVVVLSLGWWPLRRLVVRTLPKTGAFARLPQPDSSGDWS